MARFVLVAGAWHGAWSWELVIPRLQARGHRAQAAELPGTGSDRTSFAGLDMMAWANSVAGVIASDPEPVLLVGHSRGGAVISQTAEVVPDAIRRSIYLAAVLLRDGESSLDTVSLVDTGAVTAHEFVPTTDGLAIEPSDAIDLAYRHSGPDVVQRARARVTPEPNFGLFSPLTLTAERYGRVPRAYIECLDDEVSPIALQRAMQAREPCSPVHALPTDHSPNYSAPDLLVEALHDIATAV
ncbi:MAG: alpha/beta fold hydrolase [Mycobacterium sp.]